VVFSGEGVECHRREISSMSRSKEWTTPLGQNGGRSNLKRVSEPAVMSKSLTNERYVTTN